MGEMIVEIMRAKSEVPHSTPGEYLGPYASGAPAIMISAAARMGVPAGIIGGVGRDAFGDVIVNRLTGCGVDCSSLTELMMSDRCGFAGDQIMFSSNDTPEKEFKLSLIHI